MPFTKIGGTRIFYRLDGVPGLPVLVLSHSLGCDHAMWDLQVPSLLPYFQVLRCDTRGHGASDAPADEYSIAQLGGDLLGLADALEITQFAFCGLSLGGAIGQWLAMQAPQRVTQLILANTSPKFGSPANWDTRIASVKKDGMAGIADAVMQRFFSPRVLAQSPDAASVRAVFLATNPQGYIGCCAAVRDADFTQSLRQIKLPTLTIVGDLDVSTPWAGNGEILAREIAGSQVVRLPAAHLSNIERPRSFTSHLLEFLLPPPSSSDPTESGYAKRRAVLGDAHVDKSIADATEFNRDFLEMITRYAWGTIWTRPGLRPRTRRLLVLATTAALGRWEEFRLHLRAGLDHELEPCEVKEVLMQTAVYAGVPAANTAFHIAGEVIEEMKIETMKINKTETDRQSNGNPT